MPREIVKTVRDFIQQEIRSVYTVSMVLVEEVDSENRRVDVSLKTDSEVYLTDIPIASPYAGDGVGMVVPIEQGDTGAILHSKKPIEEQVAKGEQHNSTKAKRRFTLDSAFFLPEFWCDNEDVPNHEPGEFQIAHQGGSILSMYADGTVEVLHSSGNHIFMDKNGIIQIGNPDSDMWKIPWQMHTHKFEYDGAGEQSSMQTGETEPPKQDPSQNVQVN